MESESAVSGGSVPRTNINCTAEHGFEAFLRQGLPAEKRRELAAMVQRHITDGTNFTLDERVTEAMLEMHRQLFSSYRQSLTAACPASSHPLAPL